MRETALSSRYLFLLVYGFLFGVSTFLLEHKYGIVDSIWDPKESSPSLSYSYTSITFESREEYLERGAAYLSEIGSLGTRLQCMSYAYTFSQTLIGNDMAADPLGVCGAACVFRNSRESVDDKEHVAYVEEGHLFCDAIFKLECEGIDKTTGKCVDELVWKTDVGVVSDNHYKNSAKYTYNNLLE